MAQRKVSNSKKIQLYCFEPYNNPQGISKGTLYYWYYMHNLRHNRCKAQQFHTFYKVIYKHHICWWLHWDKKNQGIFLNRKCPKALAEGNFLWCSFDTVCMSLLCMLHMQSCMPHIHSLCYCRRTQLGMLMNMY